MPTQSHTYYNQIARYLSTQSRDLGGTTSYFNANHYAPRSAIRLPPGFIPFSYLSYDKMILPRPEFKKFSGDPLEFKTFFTNFKTHIEP